MPVNYIFRCELKDLEIKQIIGIGAFGVVKIVRAKGNGKTYALKQLSKKTIVENSLHDHVMSEMRLLEELHHPFIINLHCAMQNDRYIYFLLELLLGGELFKFLRAETQFPENWSKFYSASVLMAFRLMHSKNIAYRDLKPENLVLDMYGYVKVVDFGLAKKIQGGKTWTLCGTPDYLAPEIIMNEGHDFAVDYWALGVLIFEMTAGCPPFFANDPMDVYEKILTGHFPIPDHFSSGITDLTRKLLRVHQSKRLGRTKGGAKVVMKHKWFSGFDWVALLGKKMKEVPILPKISNDEDSSNFDSHLENEGEEEELNQKDFVNWAPVL